MTTYACLTTLLLLTASTLSAQQVALPDSALATGTRARFQSHTTTPGWHEGVLARLYPQGETCLAVHSDELHGAVTLASIDSLQVDRSGWRQLSGSPGAAPAAVWVTVSPQTLHAREHCTH